MDRENVLHIYFNKEVFIQGYYSMCLALFFDIFMSVAKGGVGGVATLPYMTIEVHILQKE